MPIRSTTRSGHPDSVETGASWKIATVALVILALAYGGPLLSAVAMKPIAAELGAPRSAAALAASLALVGAGSAKCGCSRGRSSCA